MVIGVFGGTFNPIHLGHLRVAEEACEILGLDRLVFVPAKLPPHKSSEGLADAESRLKLVKLAVEGNPRFAVSDTELKRPGPSYSVDTIGEIMAEMAPRRLWFIMGADQYAEIHTWRRFKDIIRMADLAVLGRPGTGFPPPPPSGMEGEFRPAPEGLIHESGRETRFLKVTQLAISSTAIREALKSGRSIRYLVPGRVRAVLAP